LRIKTSHSGIGISDIDRSLPALTRNVGS
jgi:hypothetical protein